MPRLEGSFAEAFDGPVQQVTLKAGSVLSRVGAPGGNWFGVQIPQSVAEAENLYNLAKWGNAIDTVRMYELTQDVTGYFGKVSGGTGNQFFIPYGVELDTIIKVIAEKSLYWLGGAMAEIPSILLKIARLLEDCAYADHKKIVCLQQWANDLLSASSEHAELETLATIQGIIAGMNSLSDIYLSPPACSSTSKSEANQMLSKLIIDLDRCVRRKLGL